MSESLTRSRRCNGRAAFHYVTEYLKIPGKTKCSDDAQVQKVCLLHEIYTGYERWPCVRTGWLIADQFYFPAITSCSSDGLSV